MSTLKWSFCWVFANFHGGAAHSRVVEVRVEKHMFDVLVQERAMCYSRNSLRWKFSSSLQTSTVLIQFTLLHCLYQDVACISALKSIESHPRVFESLISRHNLVYESVIVTFINRFWLGVGIIQSQVCTKQKDKVWARSEKYLALIVYIRLPYRRGDVSTILEERDHSGEESHDLARSRALRARISRQFADSSSTIRSVRGFTWDLVHVR